MSTTRRKVLQMTYDRVLAVEEAEELLDAMAAAAPTAATAKPQIIGDSRLNQEFLKTLDKVAAMDAHVLVQGEKGTGKMLVARAVHYLSRRSQRPFLTVYCGEAAETVNAEIFGTDQGEQPARRGILEMADGGTLFLDMIEDCPPETQRRLSAYLENGYFTREDSPRPVFADVRLVISTHGGLKKKVDEGAFRSELYYRLGAAMLQTPPLRDRREDIPTLTEFFLQKAAERDGGRPLKVGATAAEALYAYDWPDNVAQLAGVVDKAVALCEGGEIGVEHLPDIAA